MHYDLIIIGGGLVGAGLASALRDTSLHIALVDARLPSNDDPRLFALNQSSCQFLENLGIWPRLAAHAASIHQVHVSHQGHFGAVRLNREDVHLSALGYVIPAQFIEAELNAALSQLSNVTVYRPATLKSLKQQDGLATLMLETQEGEKTLQSGMVIGADGTESTVRAQTHIAAKVFDYGQSAIVTRTMLKRTHHHVAYERFNTQGAIAMLPLVGHECATIWTADSRTITRLMALSEDLFLQELQRAFGYRLGRLQSISKRHVFPLRMVRAEKAVDGCVFLLGNALHTLHPIAAQGFNLALYEVALLTETIIDAMAKGSPISSKLYEKIASQIQKQQLVSTGLSHRLARWFTQDSALMSMALQVGMLGLDTVTPVKRKFIEKIMGRTGHVPRLLLSANE